MKHLDAAVRKRCSLAAAAVAATLISGYAEAQQPVLEEVVVTATKRAVPMQDIPIAVQALTEDAMDDFGITTNAPGTLSFGAGVPDGTPRAVLPGQEQRVSRASIGSMASAAGTVVLSARAPWLPPSTSSRSGPVRPA